MPETHGELIKKLRRERGLTQQQLAEGISTRTTLSSFENNKSRISADILFKYIEKMNISIQEYLFYFNDSTATEKEIATQHFYNNVIKKRDSEIRKRILNYQNKYKNSKDFWFCCLAIELKLFLNNRHIEPVFDVKEDIKILKEYLNKIQQWGHFELSIFSNCLYIFSTEYIRGTYSTLLKKEKILSQIDTYENDLSIFLNNCIVLSFQRREYKNIAFYCDQLYKISEKTPRKAFDRIMYNYYKELLKYCLGLHYDVTKYINMFEDLGFTEHAENLRNFQHDLSFAKRKILLY